MNDLVFVQNESALTNSFLVAEKFKKEHSIVVRDIDNLLEKVKGVENQCDTKMGRPSQMFEAYYDDIPQPNGGVKQAKRYIMNRDGFTLLVMGYTGKKAMQFKLDYISAFNTMEKTLKEQAKPKSREELLVESAQLLLEQSKRIEKVESRLDAMEKEREENTRQLLAAKVSEKELPTMRLRDNIRQLVNRYANARNISQSEVWHKVYDQLYYLFHISIRGYKKGKNESNLDVADRNGFLDKIYEIISSMVRLEQAV